MQSLRCPAGWCREPHPPGSWPASTDSLLETRALRGGSRCPGTRPETGQWSSQRPARTPGLSAPLLLGRGGERSLLSPPGTFLNKGSWHSQDSFCFCCCRGRVASQGARERNRKNSSQSSGQLRLAATPGPAGPSREPPPHKLTAAHTPAPGRLNPAGRPPAFTLKGS